MKFGQFIKEYIENPERDNLAISEYDQEVIVKKSNDDIIITDEFTAVINSIHKKKGEFHFVSGVAGTGKSTLINKIREIQKTNVIVVAPTGIAALNVDGTTIHSTFQLDTSIFPNAEYKAYKAPMFELWYFNHRWNING